MVEPDTGERLPVTHTRHLPQLDGGMFLTDGGLETDMIFNRGRDLPLFAAFTLLETEDGTDELRRYYEPYLELAAEHELGFVLESPTWRASPRWAAELGMSDERLGELNRKSIELMEELRSNAPDGVGPIMISGQIGPQDDGYNPSARLSADEARDYHSTQIETFAETEADLVTALTMTYVEEALGVTRAAAAASIPVVISFTVETDGRLPSGQSLAEAIEQADAETDSGPAYYMINCAHPTHFDDVVSGSGEWKQRILGLRANASTKSHAELDEATELDAGDPEDLGERYAALAGQLPNLTVLGGCCGTDHRHVTQVCGTWMASVG